MTESDNPTSQDARKPLSVIAEELGFPAEAVAFVAGVGPYMDRSCEYWGQSDVPHTDALGFCKHLWAFAIESFGRQYARLLMEEWGIRHAEDIGRIVFALVAAGWLEASETDAESDFAGLGTVNQLFDGGFGRSC